MLFFNKKTTHSNMYTHTKKVSKYLMILVFRIIKGILVVNLHPIRMLRIHLENCSAILNQKNAK